MQTFILFIFIIVIEFRLVKTKEMLKICLQKQIWLGISRAKINLYWPKNDTFTLVYAILVN